MADIHAGLRAAGFTVRPAFTEVEMAVFAIDGAGRLGYLRASDEWTDGLEPLEDDLQDAAHRLLERGWLPEFEEVTRTEETPEPVDSIDIEDFVREPCACGHQRWRHGPLGRQCAGERYSPPDSCDCPAFRDPATEEEATRG